MLIPDSDVNETNVGLSLLPKTFSMSNVSEFLGIQLKRNSKPIV